MVAIDIKLLAALAPAILCALLLAGIYVPGMLGSALARLSRDEERLEWWYHVVLHGSFYGSVLNVIIGFESHSTEAEVITGVWFILGLFLSRLLSKQLSTLREEERAKDHKRMAGTVRSIVKNEVRAALANKVDTANWQD